MYLFPQAGASPSAWETVSLKEEGDRRWRGSPGQSWGAREASAGVQQWPGRTSQESRAAEKGAGGERGKINNGKWLDSKNTISFKTFRAHIMALSDPACRTIIHWSLFLLKQQERLDIEEKYTSLQEEAQGKTKKLKKVWTMLMAAKSEVSTI